MVITYLDLEVIQGRLTCVKKFLQILVQILEHKSEFAVRVEHIDKSHDVWMR